MKGDESIEKKLREVRPVGLPDEWRDDILGTALGAKKAGARETLVAFFPRPLLVGLAAAWAVILVLGATMPREEGKRFSEARSEGLERVALVAWVEHVQAIKEIELDTAGGWQ